MAVYGMLQRNLVYTGVTRAKKLLVMVGTKKALGVAVRTVTVSKRNTMLADRIRDNRIDRVAERVFEEHRAAFEELAK